MQRIRVSRLTTQHLTVRALRLLQTTRLVMRKRLA
jgi:hypothetical protein